MPTPPLPVAPKALVAHRGALGAGIVADIVLRPPVEVDIDDAAICFMRSSALAGIQENHEYPSQFVSYLGNPGLYKNVI
jgi:hypothetical protein